MSDGIDKVEHVTDLPVWQQLAEWANYIARPHVDLVSDETGTIVSVVEVRADVGGLRIAQVVTSFDLVGGEHA